MFSTRRRCTASSSAIKMVTAMAFPATCDYLSRFGALKPMAINVLLRGACRVVTCRDVGHSNVKQVRPYGSPFLHPAKILHSTEIDRPKVALRHSEYREVRKTSPMESRR